MIKMPNLREALDFTKSFIHTQIEKKKIALTTKLYEQKVVILYHYVDTDNMEYLERFLNNWSQEESFKKFQFQFGLKKDVVLLDKKVESHPIFQRAQSEKAIQLLKKYGCSLYHSNYCHTQWGIINQKLETGQSSLLVALLREGIGFRDFATLIRKLVEYEIEGFSYNKENSAHYQELLNFFLLREGPIDLDMSNLGEDYIFYSNFFKEVVEKVDLTDTTVKNLFEHILKHESGWILLEALINRYTNAEYVDFFLEKSYEKYAVAQIVYVENLIKKLEAHKAQNEQSILEKEIPALSVGLSTSKLPQKI